VRAYAAARGWTHSAFTTPAYKRFLDGDRGDRDLVVRCLTSWRKGLERFLATLELLGMTFALYAKVWFGFECCSGL